MNSDCSSAPDQPSPEALPLTEEEAPLPVTETLPDYPPGVERRQYPRLKSPVVAASVRRPRKRKQGAPSDLHAKRTMIFFCLILLIANLCVGLYVVLTWSKRTKRPVEPVPVHPPEKPKKNLPPPPRRPIDIGMGRHRFVAEG